MHRHNVPHRALRARAAPRRPAIGYTRVSPTNAHRPIVPSAPTPAYYNADIDAWVLSRHVDVVAALESPLLVARPVDVSLAAARAARVEVRDAARRAFGAEEMHAWRTRMQETATTLVARACRPGVVDVMRSVAQPFSCRLAAHALGADEQDTAPLMEWAHAVFESAACSTTGDATPDGAAAASRLATALYAPSATRRAPIDVQSFVALSHTLPAVLASSWHALVLWPQSAPLNIDELLRCGGVSRAVFRRASADVEIGGASIRANQRVALLLSSANRDADRFADPDRLDFARDASAQLSLGRGAHACVGGSIVREALAAATRAMLPVLREATVVDVSWMEGFAIRAPTSLRLAVRLRPSA